MRIRLALLLLVYAAAVVESSIPLFTNDFSIHCLILIVVAAIWTMTPGEATAWGALVGLMADAVSGGPMGHELLAFSSFACLLSALRQRWECRSLAALSLVALTTAFILLMLSPAVLAIRDGSAVTLLPQITVALVSAVATGILAALLAGIGRLFRRGFVPYHHPFRV